ncbi:MAG: prepilin-type N-terminal cleavage/methylation domain-containing protein [Legionella sp.]|nr:prepilin-type N-terminal cleavage/methylation domain-containing protein [Legionella sp.]
MNKGFTLIELLLSLTIAMLLILSTTSSLSGLLVRNEQQILIDEISQAVNYAKLQSVILGHKVILSPVNNNWSAGMNLYDIKKQKRELIYHWEWKHPSLKIDWAGVNQDKTIIFSNNPLDGISNGTFRIINVQTKKQTQIVLNRLGRIKVKSNSII